MSTSTVQMKKSSGSGDRARPISFFPGVDFVWAMGVQPNQTPKISSNRTPIRRHEVLQPVPTSVDLARWWRRRLIEPWMDGSG